MSNNQLSLFDINKKDVEITKPIRLIELFAGYGSQAMAMKRLGINFESYRMIEFDKYAVKSYNAVHNTDYDTTDIRDIHGSDLGIVDTDLYEYFMTYSFPCTDISLAGKQLGMSKDSNTRSSLLWEVERILTELKESDSPLPQILFMENVPAVHNKKNLPDFQKWIQFLEQLGYHSFYHDLNAKDYGVPQSRNRCFMFSFLDDVRYEFPAPFSLENPLSALLEKEVDEKYYIKTEKAEKLIKDLIAKNILSDINKASKSFNDNDSIKQKEEKTPVIDSKIKQIGNLVERENYANPQVGRVYSSDGISPTLSTMQGGDRQPKVIVKSNICIDDTQGFEATLRIYDNVAPSLRSQRSGLKTIVTTHRGYVEAEAKTAEQQLEHQTDGVSNTLATVQKDNLVLKNTVINDRGFKDKEPQISHGYTPTLRAEAHGNLPKIVERVGQISSEGSQCGTVFSDRGLAPTTKKQDAFDCYTTRFGENSCSNEDIAKVDKSLIPDHTLLTGGFPCLTGDALIWTKKGEKELINVKVGDFVLSHDGRYHRVLNFFEQGVKMTYKIRVKGYRPVIATANHKFLVREKYVTKNAKCISTHFSEPKWMQVDEMKGKNVYFAGMFPHLIGTEYFSRSFDWKPLESITEYKELPVYDIEVQDTHSFVVNGRYISHNCQDYSVAHSLSKSKGIEGKKRCFILADCGYFKRETATIWLV